MTRDTRRAGIRAFLVVAGSVIAGLALSVGSAGAQTAPIPNPTPGTDSRGDTNSVCSGGDCLAQFNSTGSGDAIARNGSTASGCSEATNNSTTSGALCPATAAEPAPTIRPAQTTSGATATPARLAMTGASGTLVLLAAAATLSLLAGLALVQIARRPATPHAA